MSNTQAFISFEQFIDYVFDHPIPGKFGTVWHEDFSALYRPSETAHRKMQLAALYAIPPVIQTAYLIKLFKDAPKHLSAFTDAQIAQGLWFLTRMTDSDYLSILRDPTIPFEDRVACLQAMGTLFRDLFAPRCSANLNHTLTANHKYQIEPNPLDSMCYMWWDLLPVIPIHYNTDKTGEAEKLIPATVAVMTEELQLNSIACMEGAIHGLGHWSHYVPHLTTPILTAFIEDRHDLPTALRTYAEAAITGSIE